MTHTPRGAGLESLVPVRPLVVGHRGAPSVAPANTIPGLRVAISQGAEMVLVDVRVTADGIPVLCAEALHPLGTGRWVRIKETTLEVLRRLPGGDAVHLPTLDDVLQTLGREMAFALELHDDAGGGDAVLALLHRRGVLRQALLLSPSRAVVRALAAKDGCVPMGLRVAEPGAQRGSLAAGMLGRRSIKEARQRGEAFALLPWSLVGPRVMDEAHRSAVKVLAYDLADADLEEAVELGLFGVLTSEPRQTREALDRLGEGSGL